MNGRHSANVCRTSEGMGPDTFVISAVRPQASLWMEPQPLLGSLPLRGTALAASLPSPTHLALGHILEQWGVWHSSGRAGLMGFLLYPGCPTLGRSLHLSRANSSWTRGANTGQLAISY